MAENGLLVQHRNQGIFENLCRDFREYDSVVTALRSRTTRTGTQWLGSVPVLGPGYPFPGRTLHVPLPFSGTTDECFIRLHDPAKEGRFLLRGTG